jgi:hypothetical protein
MTDTKLTPEALFGRLNTDGVDAACYKLLYCKHLRNQAPVAQQDRASVS